MIRLHPSGEESPTFVWDDVGKNKKKCVDSGMGQVK